MYTQKDLAELTENKTEEQLIALVEALQDLGLALLAHLRAEQKKAKSKPWKMPRSRLN